MGQSEVSRGRALVIDDDPAVRELVGELLRRLGFDVHTAASGPEGLPRLERETYALVVTDLVMPAMTGWEVIEAVRQRVPWMAVILASGSTTNLDTDRARAAGVVVLAKPFRFEELKTAVEAALRASVVVARRSGPIPPAAELGLAESTRASGSPDELLAVTRAADQIVRQATVRLQAVCGMMEDLWREREAWWSGWTALQEAHRSLRDAHDALIRTHQSTAETLAELQEADRRLQEEHGATVRLLGEIHDQLESCIQRLGRRTDPPGGGARE